jgi:hypothetical protein
VNRKALACFGLVWFGLVVAFCYPLFVCFVVLFRFGLIR